MISGKELMINDYVDAFGNGDSLDFGIVHEIRYCGKEIVIGFDGDASGIFAENEISPIRLTKEFFLQNGFIELYANEYIVRLYNRDNCLRIRMYLPKGFHTSWSIYTGIHTIDINYVHEFQHYLRSMNLSSYADNLKI